jgi:RNA polymerase sigma-70 factor (ECF subfamily)
MDTKKSQFMGLMEKHQGIIYKVVNAYCQIQYDRHDLAQEILTTMWLAFDKYNSDFKFSTWMYRIALNVAISYYRKDKSRQQRVEQDEDKVLNFVDDSIEQSEDIKDLYRFIGELDKLNKAIMLLYLEGESHDSIASSLGITKSNVATRIGRIKETLKQQFMTQEY